jgi:hypothetical protein
VGYRVYRSPVPGAPAGSEELLAALDGNVVEFFDDGGATDPAIHPRSPGDLGAWWALPSLGAAREGLGLAFAQNPSSAGTWHLYAVAGSTGSAALGSYEYLTIDASTADGVQTAAPSWTSGVGNVLATARAFFGLAAVTDVETTLHASGDTWLYACGGGNADLSSFANRCEAARVQADGSLTSWTALGVTTSARAGFALFAAANQLRAFGGASGVSSSGGAAATLCAGLPCGAIPETGNWNPSTSLLESRLHPGSAAAFGGHYVVGGVGGSSAALRTTEQLRW